jgi:hypothetical protein
MTRYILYISIYRNMDLDLNRTKYWLLYWFNYSRTIVSI